MGRQKQQTLPEPEINSDDHDMDAMRSETTADQFETVLYKIPAITEALHVTGSFDYLIRASIPDGAHLDQLVRQLKHTARAAETHTRLALRGAFLKPSSAVAVCGCGRCCTCANSETRRGPQIHLCSRDTGPATEFLERRRRRRGLARRRAALGDCDACGHPWNEHSGSGNDIDGVCGECAYEFEHDQRETSASGCRLPCPPVQ